MKKKHIIVEKDGEIFYRDSSLKKGDSIELVYISESNETEKSMELLSELESLPAHDFGTSIDIENTRRINIYDNER